MLDNCCSIIQQNYGKKNQMIKSMIIIANYLNKLFNLDKMIPGIESHQYIPQSYLTISITGID